MSSQSLSELFYLSVFDYQWKFLFGDFQNMVLQIFIQRKIYDSDIFLFKVLTHLFHKKFVFFVLKAEAVSQNQKWVFLQQNSILLSSPSDSTAFGKQRNKLSFGHQIFTDIKSSNELPLTINLGVCGPSTVISNPVPHVLILNNIVVGELNLVFLQYFEHSLCKSAFWVLGRTLYKNYDR